jgi:hypothetical protein
MSKTDLGPREAGDKLIDLLAEAIAKRLVHEAGNRAECDRDEDARGSTDRRRRATGGGNQRPSRM